MKGHHYLRTVSSVTSSKSGCADLFSAAFRYEDIDVNELWQRSRAKALMELGDLEL